ncbi:MAG: flagellar transcriptional regulator FlhD [Pirellulaceae bacterium]|jgi:flagellar transcriptional activator FlhD|nr:flagellar transcriptional regulator FlhD [Pirellulaceae bacterium]
MKTTELFSEIKELNLAYLMLAQHMLKEDREAAMFKLGVSDDVAEMLGNITPGQLLRMASSSMLLCRFRFDDRLVLNLLSNHKLDAGTATMHATILAADRPVESIA